MENIILRQANLNDLPILLEFEQGIITTEKPFDETLKKEHFNYYDIAGMIKAENTEVVVAECSNEIIGSAYADIREAKQYLQHEKYAYLGFMYVKPNFRGRGINGGIIAYLKNWSKSKNISELRLDVYDENFSAVKAYEKAGFKRHLLNMRINIDDE